MSVCPCNAAKKRGDQLSRSTASTSTLANLSIDSTTDVNPAWMARKIGVLDVSADSHRFCKAEQFGRFKTRDNKIRQNVGKGDERERRLFKSAVG